MLAGRSIVFRSVRGGLFGVRWLSSEIEKSSVVKEPTIKLKLEQDGKKKSLLGSSSPEPKFAGTSSVPLFLDTHEAITKLQTAGYTLDQAEAVVKLLVECQSSSVAPLHVAMVASQDLELAELRMKVELEDLEHQLTMLEHTKLKAYRGENEAVKEKVEKLMSTFKEEVVKVQSNLQLDLNLEKGRIKEDATVLLQQVKDTSNKIDREVAQIRVQIEFQKLESVKYFAGVAFSVVTVVLSVVFGVYRMLK